MSASKVQIPNRFEALQNMTTRAQTSMGEIARYVLEKLYQYGKAIGFLNGA